MALVIMLQEMIAGSDSGNKYNRLIACLNHVKLAAVTTAGALYNAVVWSIVMQ